MIFDTGSNWLWINSKLCVNCPIKGGFNQADSSFFKVVKKQIRLDYGSGSVIGYNAFDRICLDEGEMCTKNDFSWLLTLKQNGLDFLKVEGLVGLSPFQMDSNGDMFLEQLKINGAIDHQSFSMSIAKGDG